VLDRNELSTPGRRPSSEPNMTRAERNREEARQRMAERRAAVRARNIANRERIAAQRRGQSNAMTRAEFIQHAMGDVSWNDLGDMLREQDVLDIWSNIRPDQMDENTVRQYLLEADASSNPAPWYAHAYPHYGQYCGPYWNNGGRRESLPVALVPPDDEVDRGCMFHDMALASGANPDDADAALIRHVANAGGTSVSQNVAGGAVEAAIVAQRTIRSFGVPDVPNQHVQATHGVDGSEVFNEIRKKAKKTGSFKPF